MGSQEHFFCVLFIPIILPSFTTFYFSFMSHFYLLHKFFIIYFLIFIFYKKSILHFSYWVILCSEKHIKIPESANYHRAGHFFETHFKPYFFSIFCSLIYKMFFASINFWNRTN